MKFLFLWLLLFTGFISLSQTKNEQRFEYVRPQMGTLFRIVLYAESEAKAQAAAHAAFSRVQELNSILSDYDPNSELSQLAATAGSGKPVKLVLTYGISCINLGKFQSKPTVLFDVTIGPVVQLWRRARRQHLLPSDTAIAQAKRLSGYRNVCLNPQAKTALLRIPGMQLDMGAIGKGYAVDEAMKVLKVKGIRSALVDGGGNIVVSQPPPHSKGWIIDLEPLPGTAQQEPQKIILAEQGVATSGDLYQFVEINGVRYSHIVDPFTGVGLTDQSRVIIISRNATDADWLATSLSILSPAQGMILIENTPQTAAVIVKNKNNVFEWWQSKKYKRYFEKIVE